MYNATEYYWPLKVIQDKLIVFFLSIKSVYVILLLVINSKVGVILHHF